MNVLLTSVKSRNEHKNEIMVLFLDVVFVAAFNVVVGSGSVTDLYIWLIRRLK